MIPPITRLILTAVLWFAVGRTYAQKIIINTSDSIYELIGPPGNCTLGPAIPYCTSDENARVFSTALTKKNLYFVSGKAELYRTPLGTPNQCRQVAFLPSDGARSNYNSLTVDVYGNVYALSETGQLVRYHYPDANAVILGRTPEGAGGDMIFHKGELYYAAVSGDIYKINIEKPEASVKHMSLPGFEIYGLISFPYACNQNKVYGIQNLSAESRFVEIDLDNKTFGGTVCSIPFMVYDAASVVEDGKTAGVIVDSIAVYPPCGSITSGSAKFYAFSAAPGDLTYTMNGVSNSSGVFDNLLPGTHYVKISNANNCFFDTSVVIANGLSPYFIISKIQPTSCTQRDGQLTVSGISTAHLPVTYSINNSPFTLTPSFSGLGAGTHSISILDQSGCVVDTVVSLSYAGSAKSIQRVTVLNEFCNGANGMISLSVDPTLINWQTSLNNSTPAKSLQFTNLVSSSYTLSVYSEGGCRYDTTIIVNATRQAMPMIGCEMIPASCSQPNGEIELSINGADAPYDIIFEGRTYDQNHRSFKRLTQGWQNFSIRSAAGCSWDTAFLLAGKPVSPIKFVVHSKAPTCSSPASGEIMIEVNGDEGPYQLVHGTSTFRPGFTLTQLKAGKHIVDVLNQDGCVVQSINATLTMIEEPECDRFIMPNAFTPNRDGHNETIKPVHSPFARSMRFDIFNRYGQRMFRYNGSGQGWDGTLGGRQQPGGNYIWLATYINTRGESITLKGSFLLIR